MKQSITPRRGFTLVELLVAAALTMLIMAILASTFQTAMDGMSHLRAAAEMQDRLRSANVRLRADLASPHFDDEAIARGQLSSLRFDLPNVSLPAGGYFNVIQVAPSTLENRLGAVSPNDYSSISTNHALAFTAKLSGKNAQNLFTAPRPAGTLDQSNDNLVNDPLSTYASKWAVVSWFLTASDATTGPNPRAMYTLHRRVKLLAETADCFIDITSPYSNHYAYDTRSSYQKYNPLTNSYTAITNTNLRRVLTVKDLAIWSALPELINGNLAENPPLNIRTSPDLLLPAGDGSDIVVSNVLSFEVKADYSTVISSNPVTNAIAANVTLNTPAVPANPQHPTLAAGMGYSTIFPRPAMAPNDSLTFLVPNPAQPNVKFYHPFANPDFPFDDLPRPYLHSIYDSVRLKTVADADVAQLQRLFDTGSNPGYRIKALQIKIRIYDPKTQTSRQVTIVQEV